MFGDLFVEEEKVFVVIIDVPVHRSGVEDASLFIVTCYIDSNTKELVNFEEDEANELKIQKAKGNSLKGSWQKLEEAVFII